METTHTHTMSEHPHAEVLITKKLFYTCIGILAVAIVILQPLAMLTVMFAQALQ